jgi:hypothetical protein
VDKNIDKTEIETIEIKQEIEKLYSLFIKNEDELRDNLSFNPVNIKIKFPLFVFKSVLYEYIKNAHNWKKNSFSIHVNKRNDNVEIIISNDFNKKMNPQEKERIEKLGYNIAKSKGLYKNILLLRYVNCDAPKIDIQNEKKPYFFNVKINLKDVN